MKNQNVKTVSQSIKNLKLKQFILILLGALNSILSVLFALSIQFILQVFTNNEGPFDKVTSIIISASLILLVFVITTFANAFSEKIKIEAEISVKKDVLKRYFSTAYLKSSQIPSGEVINRVQSDCASFAMTYVMILPQIVNVIISLLAIVVALVVLSPTFTVVLICSGLLMIVITYFVRKITMRLFKKTREKDGETSALINEATSNLLTVKGLRAENKVLDMISEKLLGYQSARKTQRYFQSAFSSLNHLLFNAIYLTAIVVSLVVSVNYPQGVEIFSSFALVSIIQLLMQARSPITAFAPIINTYYEMGVCADRIVTITGFEQQYSSPKLEVEKIFVNGVSFSYDNEKVIDNLTFTIDANQKVLINGKTGAGKSTLLKLITGVYAPSEGSVDVYYDKGFINSYALKGAFAVAFQGNMLFSGTLKDNITLINESASDEEILDAIHFACLDDVIESVGGLNGVIGEKGTTISEGQAQRVAIARAYIANRPILVLDEPTSALDSKTEIQLLENIKNSHKTVIMVSHSQNAKNYVDKTISLN